MLIDPFALRGAHVTLADRIDRGFGTLARGFGAEPWAFAPFVRVADLRRIDYFTSFPHLISFPAAPAAIEPFRAANGAGVEGPLVAPAIAPVDRVLAPAACYALYPALRGRDLRDATYTATTVGTCFRREDSYRALERLPSFRMREVIHVGTAASARAFLDAARERVTALSAAWGIDVAYEVATDPFFDPARSPKYVHQRLFPSKHEMCCGGLALGSFNLHRNFFGEAFELRAAGEAAHTACVAFGIERWVGAIVRAHGDDPASWPADLAEAPVIPWHAQTPAVQLALAASGLFLLVGLITGVWKYHQIMASPERRAHVYVDIGHRASLMYSFASLVLGHLAAASILPGAVNVAAVALPVGFFGVAIATYVRLAIEATTDNQYKRRSFTTTTGVWLLAVCELAGVVVLLAGVAAAALA